MSGKEGLLTFQEFKTPKDYVDSVRARLGTVHGVLGNNALDNGNFWQFYFGHISEEELDKSIVFKEEVVGLVLPEFTESQKREYLGFLLGELEKSDEFGKVVFEDSDILNLVHQHDELLKRNCIIQKRLRFRKGY